MTRFVAPTLFSLALSVASPVFICCSFVLLGGWEVRKGEVGKDANVTCPTISNIHPVHPTKVGHNLRFGHEKTRPEG